ncbi:unnamed protein product [Euphydryas editha]|uniref:Uncharacterized protein n=1 Tax=Euphydryas editha TaxID=104508 RepID=A0AAU9TJG1_EUPED|nr:unnamed protein product [Euphydryas editha]
MIIMKDGSAGNQLIGIAQCANIGCGERGVEVLWGVRRRPASRAPPRPALTTPRAVHSSSRGLPPTIDLKENSSSDRPGPPRELAQCSNCDIRKKYRHCESCGLG